MCLRLVAVCCCFFYIFTVVSFQVSPVLSDTFLQSARTSQEEGPALLLSSCHWLDDSGCQALTSAYIPPPTSSSVHSNPALIPPPTCFLSSAPGCNSYHGNLYTPSSTCSGDWMLPDSLSWGQGSAPGEELPVCVSSTCACFCVDV